MRVLVTGAGGSLGRTVTPLLAAAGHEPVLFDIAAVDSAHQSMVGDVRDFADVRRAMEGVDIVVHGAAIHGIHLADHSSREFYELNLTGTFNVWEAAVEAGVKGVVFSSTMGVYGDSGKPTREDKVVALDEDMPLLPGDIYGYTKLAGEEMCRYYGRRYGIASIALRYGMFVPEPFFRYGVRLLYGGVDADDVARSVVAAMEALASGTVTWDAFNVESPVPFTTDDGPRLRREPLEVVDRYYPGAAELLRERGIEHLKPIGAYYPMERIQATLGFRPECDFGRWLAELRARPNESAAETGPWW